MEGEKISVMENDIKTTCQVLPYMSIMVPQHKAPFVTSNQTVQGIIPSSYGSQLHSKPECVCGRKDVHKTIKACPIKSAFPLFCSVVPTVHIFRSFSVLISYFRSKNILGKDFIALESSTPVLSWLAPCVVAEMKPVKEPYFTTPWRNAPCIKRRENVPEVLTWTKRRRSQEFGRWEK